MASPIDVKCEAEPGQSHGTGQPPPPPPPKYNDVFFGVLFVAHVIVILAVAFTKGVASVNYVPDNKADFTVPATTPTSDNQAMKGGPEAISGLVLVLFVSGGLSFGALSLAVKLGASLISVAAKVTSKSKSHNPEPHAAVTRTKN